MKIRNITGIMASTKSGVIGHNNTLPWHYPDELAHFRNTTHNHLSIMGRKTYDSTPQDLFKNSQAIVLSRNINLKLKDAVVSHSIEHCLSTLMKCPKGRKVFMIGGGEIASLFLKRQLISSFILTEIKKPYQGNVYINLNYFQNWSKVILQNTKNYTIYLLTK
jgi:dihydrofolate reductase